jgi:sugar/nucleoside kinase (ribokinase family)
MSTPHSTLRTPHSQIVIGGTIAIDHVKTPDSEAANLLGGSAAYAALAASFFSRPVSLIGIIGHDFPQQHLDMLENRGITLDGVERSENESFTWSGEYHANMNERTTHRVGLNVLENWQVKVPATSSASTIVVLANMSPDNQIEMLAQCGIECGVRNSECGIEEKDAGDSSTSSIPHFPLPTPHSNRFVIADTMDLWIEIANERLHDVLPHLDLFVLNEGEARELAGTSNLVKAGRVLLEKGPRHVVVKLGEFGAMLFSSQCGARSAEGGIKDQEKDADDSPASSTPHSPLPTPHSVEIFRCSAWPLETVADPTGAGDTFLGAMAGYLAALGAPPYDSSALRQAIIQGSMLASFTCEAFSTRRLESLTAADLEQRLQEFRQATHW